MLGGISNEMKLLVKTIASRARSEIGSTKARTVNSIFREMSMIIAKGLADQAIARLVRREDEIIDPQLHSAVRL